MNTPSPLRVLIVDDDPSSLALLARHLNNAGHEVLQSQCARQALRMLQDQGASVVITDWMMPDQDGLSLCRAIRSSEALPFVYIIIITARQTDVDGVVAAFEAGADDYIAKPIQKKELIARLRAAQRIVDLQHVVARRNREITRYNAELAIANTQLSQANDRLRYTASTDELTGLYNRRAALTRLAEYWAASDRQQQPLSCILVDIDRFKSVNDQHGHAVGDAVLKKMAGVLTRSTRREETAARFGGEEFLVLCPNACAKEARIGAERIRRAVEGAEMDISDLSLRVTISLGVAERTPEMNSIDDLLMEADRALYAAKHAGRNKVMVAGECPLSAAPPPPAAASSKGG